MDQFEKAGLVAQLQQSAVKRTSDIGRLLPRQPVLLGCVNNPVAQPLDVVASEDQLHRRKERPDELLVLVAECLPDAFGDTDIRALQLDDGEGDAVDVEHHVGPLGVLAEHRDFLGDDEVIGVRIAPVDQPDRHRWVADARLHLDAVAQQFVDLAVRLVQAVAGADSGSFLELVDGAGDQGVGVAARFEVLGEQRLFDVRVALAVLPVAAVLVAELLGEQLDDTVLRLALDLADVTHADASV